MVTLEQFKANAQSHGICEMLDDWNNAKSKKQLMDVALNVRGMQYISEAIAQGWGVSPEIITKDFSPFNNGRYVYNDGYTSTMYCQSPEDEIKIGTTTALIIDYDKTIIVDRPICELYLVNCNVIIRGKEMAKVHLYNSTIINTDERVIVESQHEY